jgi:hypothetical protein
MSDSGHKRGIKCGLVIGLSGNEVGVDNPESMRLSPLGKLIKKDVEIPDLRKAQVLSKNLFIENEPNRPGDEVSGDFYLSKCISYCK